MSISTTSINRPVLATVLNLILIIVGAIGFTYLGVRDYPSVDNPIITVSASFPGANSDVISTQITEPLEAAVNGIPGIRSISSTSRDGSSMIRVEFNLEVDLETAANDVRNKVSGAQRRLPQDMDPPVVTKADADSNPIFSVMVSSSDRSLVDLSRFADVNVRERLQTISGVSTVDMWGLKRYSVRLKMTPELLAAYRVTPVDVRQAVSTQNVELPAGRIEGDNTELTVRTLGRLKTIDDFNNLIIKRDGEKIVRFSDIGEAVIEAEDQRSSLSVNGQAMVSCNLVPLPGANYINIVDQAYAMVEQLRKEMPKDITLEQGMDATIFIRQSINEVKDTIIIAFFLVVVIIFFFLRNWRTTLIPVLAIPVSLVAAFFIMYLAGFSINILTLLAIVLSIGLVVDDAIVVMENIYTKVEQGMSPKEAGIKGANEIFFAVIATTIALVAVFFPIIFLQGITGKLFREFAIVIAGAVCVSSFVALTFTPMISTKLLSRKSTDNRFYRWSEPFFTWLINWYKGGLESFLKHRWIAVVILLAAGGGMVWLWGEIPSEMAPLEDRSQLSISATATEGTSFDYMTRYMSELSEVVRTSVPEATQTFEMVGRGGTNGGFVNLMLTDPDKRNRTQQEIADELTTKVSQLTGARAYVTQRQTFGGGRGGLPIQYVIQAPTLEYLKDVLPTFMSEVAQSPVFSASDLNLKFTKPEVTMTIDRDKASVLGVSIQNIAQTLQLTMSEQRVGYFVMDGKQYQIMSQFDRQNRNKTSNLASVYVRNDKGDLIQLDNLVKLNESSTPPQLYRYDRFVAATVSAGLAKGYTLGQGIEEMDRIKEKVLDEERFKTTLSGASKDFVESTSSLMFAFILALILIYLVLAAQFESFKDPIIIMLTVPLALFGSLLVLWAYSQTLNIFSQIGIIMLIGLVTKNGILIVEFANQRKEAGLSKRDAIREASVSRFRPILMTSLSTVLGTLPMALATGAGAESRISMGIAVVGGLICSTLLTLFVIPAIYSYISGERKEKTEDIL
ncbi:RND multidrug efflux transporter [Mucinivorans hirudinis]|uniref:RND multidrug efflux transporter n=1 Tax=Mucinivorans hirudinis TaxID=1433126 RepID=A0A060RB78_9BACT|nr:RND multidrug efflux transporter [Mucinivorans hirudinis]